MVLKTTALSLLLGVLTGTADAAAMTLEQAEAAIARLTQLKIFAEDTDQFNYNSYINKCTTNADGWKTDCLRQLFIAKGTQQNINFFGS